MLGRQRLCLLAHAVTSRFMVVVWDSVDAALDVCGCGSWLCRQISLGLANVWLHIPLAIAVAHNAMGAGLLLSVIHLSWRHHQLPQPQTSRAASTESHTTTINREVTA